MFIERLVNQGNAPLLERLVSFSQEKQRILTENISNISTPGYIQKDISLPAFQKRLRERVAQRAREGPGKVTFDDITAQVDNPKAGILFHDRGNRSIEQLMSDMSSNGLRHNMYVELLRKQYSGIQTAIRERVD